MEPDESLMGRVRTGDDAALRLLVDRYRTRLFSFLLRRIGDAAADDLFQETWIRVVRARERYDPERRFSTWMFQIANNLCRDWARRRDVERRYQEAVRPAPGDEAGRTPTPPLAERLDVRRRLDRLPERLREVLVLRYYEGLAEREIAEVVGIPQGTVKSRLHTAVRTLRGQEIEEARDAD